MKVNIRIKSEDVKIRATPEGLEVALLKGMFKKSIISIPWEIVDLAVEKHEQS